MRSSATACSATGPDASWWAIQYTDADTGCVRVPRTFHTPAINDEPLDGVVAARWSTLSPIVTKFIS